MKTNREIHYFFIAKRATPPETKVFKGVAHVPRNSPLMYYEMKSRAERVARKEFPGYEVRFMDAEWKNERATT